MHAFLQVIFCSYIYRNGLYSEYTGEHNANDIVNWI